MTDDRRKELIIKMLDSITDSQQIKKIFDFVHEIFIRRARE